VETHIRIFSGGWAFELRRGSFEKNFGEEDLSFMSDNLQKSKARKFEIMVADNLSAVLYKQDDLRLVSYTGVFCTRQMSETI
jgi:hypothetical protein